jgi:hypothetical protein
MFFTLALLRPSQGLSSTLSLICLPAVLCSGTITAQIEGRHTQRTSMPSHDLADCVEKVESRTMAQNCQNDIYVFD